MWLPCTHGKVCTHTCTVLARQTMTHACMSRVQTEELLIKAMIAGGECEEARKRAASLFANCHAAGLQVRFSHC